MNDPMTPEQSLDTLRRAIHDVLDVNSIVVNMETTGDMELAATLRTFLGRAPLAESLLLALKRSGARTAYRDVRDEGIAVRLAAHLLDNEPWPQSPMDGPLSVELATDNVSTAPGRKVVAPEVAFTEARLTEISGMEMPEDVHEEICGVLDVITGWMSENRRQSVLQPYEFQELKNSPLYEAPTPLVQDLVEGKAVEGGGYSALIDDEPSS